MRTNLIDDFIGVRFPTPVDPRGDTTFVFDPESDSKLVVPRFLRNYSLSQFFTVFFHELLEYKGSHINFVTMTTEEGFSESLKVFRELTPMDTEHLIQEKILMKDDPRLEIYYGERFLPEYVGGQRFAKYTGRLRELEGKMFLWDRPSVAKEFLTWFISSIPNRRFIFGEYGFNIWEVFRTHEKYFLRGEEKIPITPTQHKKIKTLESELSIGDLEFLKNNKIYRAEPEYSTQPEDGTPMSTVILDDTNFKLGKMDGMEGLLCICRGAFLMDTFFPLGYLQ